MHDIFNSQRQLMLDRILSVFLISLISFSIFAQSKSNDGYFISNFDYKQTGLPFANWQIIQSRTGLIYVANTEGLLTYDGVQWKNHFKSSFVSIFESSDGAIYAGLAGDFGYLSADANGNLTFNSLKEYLPENRSFQSQAWSINEDSTGIYFYSKEGVFKWGGQKLKVWNSSNYHNKIIVAERPYLIKEGVGLVSLSEKGERVVKNTQVLGNDFLNFIKKTSEGNIIGTRFGGLYFISKDSTLKHIDNDLSKFLSDNQLFSSFDSHKLRGLGTVKKGALIVDENLEITHSINSNSGLISNFIKGMILDSNMSLWLSQPENISAIDIFSPLQFYSESRGYNGLPLNVGQAFHLIFVGTNNGLFYKSENKFIKVSGIDSKVWSLVNVEIDNSNFLVVVSQQGTLLVNEDLSFEILSNSGDNRAYQLPSHKNEIILGQTSGIYLLSFGNDQIAKKELLTFSNQDQVINSIIEDEHGTLWVSAKKNGLYKIENIHSDNPNIRFYNNMDGLPEPDEWAITNSIRGLLVGTSKGVFRYHEKSDTFERSNISNSHVSNLTAFGDSIIYLSYKNAGGLSNIEQITLDKERIQKRVSKPFQRIITSTVTGIFPDKDNTTWFTTADGLYRFDETIEKEYDIPYNTLIRRVANLDSTIFNGTYTELIPGKIAPKIVTEQPLSYIPTFTYDRNTIRFEYASAFYELPERTEYSYYLEGNDKKWSTWSTEHVKEYNNLSAGNYTFKVKAKNIYDFEGEIASYQFTILAPWYQTSWAYVLFGIGGAVALWFIVLAYSYRVRQHRKKLKLIVADRTFEVISQKKEIEKQNDLLKEQNEKISSQRDAINKKNQELEISQEEVLNINQRLQELNSLLEKKVEQRTSKIKQTMQQLQQINAELDTFIYRASHDLKGPISRIHGLTSLAKLESTSPNDLKYYDLIELVAKDMNKLLAKLTQVHEVIHASVDNDLIDLPILISEVRNNISFLDQGGVTKYSFDLKNTLQIKSDPFLLRIILTNLMENALIFRKNSVNDHQIIVRADEDENSYYIEVIDNGLGIAESHINRVFNMFFRGSDQSKGSGLGLYLVKVAVEKLHGEISVTSTMNDQTTFFVKFPK